MEMPETETNVPKRQVWNAGRSVGAKCALKPKQIWEIRFYLNYRRRLRDCALFDLAIDSKLRACDLVRMKIGDIVNGGQVRTHALVMQQKTSRPVQLELLPDARASLLAWLDARYEPHLRRFRVSSTDGNAPITAYSQKYLVAAGHAG